MNADYQDWQYEVASGYTILGFAEWREHKEESLGIGGTDVSLDRLTDQRIQDEPQRGLPDSLEIHHVESVFEPDYRDVADDGPEVDILRRLQ